MTCTNNDLTVLVKHGGGVQLLQSRVTTTSKQQCRLPVQNELLLGSVRGGTCLNTSLSTLRPSSISTSTCGLSVSSGQGWAAAAAPPHGQSRGCRRFPRSVLPCSDSRSSPSASRRTGFSFLRTDRARRVSQSPGPSDPKTKVGIGYISPSTNQTAATTSATKTAKCVCMVHAIT